MQKLLDDPEAEPIPLDDSDAFEGPWMAFVDENREVHFEIDRKKTFVEQIVPPFALKGDRKTISQLRAEMRDIKYADTEEEVIEDGEHVAPFWTGRPIKAAFKKSNSKKWIRLAYIRSVEIEELPDGSTKTINSAAIKDLDFE